MNTMVVSVLLVKTVAGSVFGEGDEDDDRHQTLVSVMSRSLLRLNVVVKHPERMFAVSCAKKVAS
jgi:hypothetical protein